MEKENINLKAENIILQKLSVPFDNSMIFNCDKCDFEIEDEDALETHKELYHINPCQVCNLNFDDEDTMKKHKENYHNNKCDDSRGCDYESRTRSGLKIHKEIKHT